MAALQVSTPSTVSDAVLGVLLWMFPAFVGESVCVVDETLGAVPALDGFDVLTLVNVVLELMFCDEATRARLARKLSIFLFTVGSDLKGRKE